MTLAIAHRGDTTAFRENTLPAIRSAIDHGAHMVEIDLDRTSDGHVVLMHAEAQGRLWALPRPITEMTLAEIASLGVEVEQRIPTLMEVLAAVSYPRPTQLMLVATSVDTVLAADDLVHEHGLADQVLYAGSVEALRAVRARRPSAGLVLTWDRHALPPAELWQTLRPRYYSTQYRLLTRDLVTEVHRHGYGVAAWMVNDFPEMARLIGMGVDAIITEHMTELAKLTADANGQGASQEFTVASSAPSSGHDQHSRGANGVNGVTVGRRTSLTSGTQGGGPAISEPRFHVLE
ncbi:glycerophosphodiester phosphodiesterase [Nocardiopsis rhodophaea]|uniref:Glycerophosphodiester phosphodiesterase n=1 Tax=Nocardiopsis rhodophaea TaxID=280238 RepID=A0ABP5E815_9ACTN